MKGPIPKLAANETCFLIIDMQNDFVKANGFLGRTGQSIEPIEAMLPALTHFLAFARQTGMTRVFVKTLHDKYTNTRLWNSRFEKDGGAPSLCVPGTWGAEIVDELKPNADEAVVVKHRYDAFLDTDLSVILRAREIKYVLIAGTKTNVCIDTSARHAFMNDFVPFVLKDCVATSEAEMQEPTLLNLSTHFAYVVSSDEIMIFLSTALTS